MKKTNTNNKTNQKTQAKFIHYTIEAKEEMSEMTRAELLIRALSVPRSLLHKDKLEKELIKILCK
jgi:hypothetical protein